MATCINISVPEWATMNVSHDETRHRGAKRADMFSLNPFIMDSNGRWVSG